MQLAKKQKNPVFQSRTKHVDVHNYFIREKRLQGDISLIPIPTSKQIADKFNKGLCHNKFSKFTRELGVVSRDLALRGSVRDHCLLTARTAKLVLTEQQSVFAYFILMFTFSVG